MANPKPNLSPEEAQNRLVELAEHIFRQQRESGDTHDRIRHPSAKGHNTAVINGCNGSSSEMATGRIKRWKSQKTNDCWRECRGPRRQPRNRSAKGLEICLHDFHVWQDPEGINSPLHNGL